MSTDPGPGAPRRIASLLPSATEIVCALGLEESLIAVSHSCDFPGRIESLPRVTRTRVPGGAASREIDTVVWSVNDGPSGTYTRSDPKQLAPNMRRVEVLGEEKGKKRRGGKKGGRRRKGAATRRAPRFEGAPS